MIDIGKRLAPYFPIRADNVELGVIPPLDEQPGDESAACVVVRLIVYEERDGTTSIRDIKEQQVYIGFPAMYDDTDRVAAFFAAFAEVFAEISTDQLERLMPHDVLATDALKLKRASTREDFAAALRAKSRLGQYLNP